jgi:hypothetical protein
MSEVIPELSLVLSLVAQTSSEKTQAEKIFQIGIKPLTGEANMIPLEQISIPTLNQSIKKLASTTLDLRQQIIEASARTALSDHEITWKEREILRAIGDALDCPIPSFAMDKGSIPVLSARE